MEDHSRDVTDIDSLDGDWHNITSIEQAGRGMVVKLNRMTGEVVKQNKLIEIEPEIDAQGRKWRQFERTHG